MSTYNETFKDVDLIERAVRQKIGLLSQLETSIQHKEPEAVDKIIELVHVLGNRHNQKIGYGQKNHTGVPFRLTN